MKKTLIITICCFLTITLLGCQTSDVNKDLPNDNTANVITGIESEIKNSEETKNDSSSPVIGYQPSGNGDYEVQASVAYYSFEEACERATDVVVATFEGTRPFGAFYTEYCFYVKETIVGNAKGKISVIKTVMKNSANETVEGYNSSPLFLEYNKDYMLIILNETTVYSKMDYYSFICNLVIDVENIGNSTMYNQPLALHSKTFDFSKADKSAVIDYIKKFVKDDPTFSPVKFAADPSMEDVIAESSNILVVEINECTRNVVSHTRDTGFYNCKVLETMKGFINSGTTIQIIFSNDDVSEGDTVIVALSNTGRSSYYSLTSRNNSIIPVEQKEAAKAIIENEK